MKNYKYLNKALTFVLGAMFLAVSSCDSIIDQTEVDFGKGPVLAQFVQTSTTANFLADGTTQTYNIPITIIGGNNQPLDRPVEITISADGSSTATAGKEFALNQTTFTLQPGEMVVDAQIEVNTNELDPFDAKTLVLKIDASSEGVSEANTTAVVLQAVCELDLNNFVGTYAADNKYWGEVYEATVEIGPAPNSLLITNVEGYGDDQVLVVLSTDILNPTITYESIAYDKFIYNHGTYGHVWGTTLSPELSTYNSCDYSLNLEFKRCVSIGCFGGSRVVLMTKQ